ncbi:universal stress protein [Listeria welshimeri]|nr:universal stress protein [Listeria welshimeri]
MEKYHRILVAIDGSEPAKLAFEKGLELAIKLDGVLGIASIVDLRAFSPNVSYDGSLEEKAELELKASVNEYAEKARLAGVKQVETFVAKGNPKILLSTDIPAEFQADLIICGATGMNRMGGLCYGKISPYPCCNRRLRTGKISF